MRPDAPTHIQLAHQAKVRRLRLNPLSEDGGDAQARLVSPLLCYPFKGGNDERESFVQLESRGREWRMPIIRERATYRRTITANDRGFIVVALLDHALNRAHPTHLLFQFLLGMAICLIDRLGSLSQVVKVAKLMSCLLYTSPSPRD